VTDEKGETTKNTRGGDLPFTFLGIRGLSDFFSLHHNGNYSIGQVNRKTTNLVGRVIMGGVGTVVLEEAEEEEEDEDDDDDEDDEEEEGEAEVVA
jgi:hypothetical protein